MKKNISINISGIIFHIEEDAYERLSEYLQSINQYFSNFDDSMEIIADIEGRIAEIFLAKLTENKQVINKSDVEELIATMGSIKDFQAVEEQADESYEQAAGEEKTKWKDTSTKRLYRDEKRKLLGGVCAGIAHYFNIDPLWIRLIFVVLFFGSYGTVALIYIIMWIVVPVNYDLTEDKKLKKMYRNPERKVLGGVASGVATYFGVDVAIIRLLFVITAFIGGTGIIAYIVLWLILPEAKSITDKVQMQGEPVTLSNIESNIKKSLKVKEDDEENLLVKILLFPFRLIAAIINGLGKALGPALLFIVEFIRVAFGIVLVITGFALIFGLVVATGAIFGLLSTPFWDPYLSTGDVGIPLDIISATFPVITSIAGFFAALIPCVVLMLLGISLVAKRIIFNATVGWSLFAIFIISGIILSVNIPAIIYKFSEDGEYKVSSTYTIDDKTAVLTMREVGMEKYDVTNLRLRGHDGPEFLLEQIFEAQGSSRRNAMENAQMVTHNVELENDSVLVFDSNITFKEDAIFRAQRLEMTLYIPYGQPFMMSDNLEHIIYNTIHRAGYRVWDMPDNVWVITRESGLKCLTCKKTDENATAVSSMDYDRSFNFSDFNDIDITSVFTVTIERSNDYSVVVDGEDRYLEDMNIYQNGDKLYINYDEDNISDFIKKRDAIKVNITMPELDDIEVSGAGKVYISGFEQRRLSFDLKGASFAKANVKVDDIEMDLTGASELQLEGTGNEMMANLSAASQLNAYNYIVNRAKVVAHGASSAKVHVTNELEIEEKLASTVKYKGDARVTREKSGF